MSDQYIGEQKLKKCAESEQYYRVRWRCNVSVELCRKYLKAGRLNVIVRARSICVTDTPECNWKVWLEVWIQLSNNSFIVF